MTATLVNGTAWRAWLLATTALLSLDGAAQAQVPGARPTGGQVVAGSAAIGQTATQTTIQQSSQRAAIDWRGFDVGRDHAVQFNQPNAQAWTLNRVIGPDPSAIAGRIGANGGVAIVNQSGVVFAAGAQVNVGALIASAPGITNQNFMAGAMVFDQPARPGARVENHGTITVADRGLVALAGPRVANSGLIRARLGRVALAGAETYRLDLAGDGLLSIDVTQAVRTAPDGGAAIVTNSGVVEAAGGSVLLTAHAASGLVEDLVHNTGRISANAAEGRSGQVALRAEGGGVRVAGVAEARGGAGNVGGTIEILASGTVTVGAKARINASGGTGGGRVALGVDAASAPGRPNRLARRTVVERGAEVRADATVNGVGGVILINSIEQTELRGLLTARGGAAGGDGGLVEISGRGGFAINGAIDLTANAGRRGTVLLDPDRIVVRNVAAIIVPAGAGNQNQLVVPGASPLTATGTAGTLFIADTAITGFAANLELLASRSIVFEGGTNGAGAMTKAAGALTLTVNAADASAPTTDGIFLQNTSLTLSNGALTISSTSNGVAAAGTVEIGAALRASAGIAVTGGTIVTTAPIRADAGGIALTAPTSITLRADLRAVAQTVTLRSDGAITQTLGSIIIADTVVARGADNGRALSITLNQANQVTNLTARASGAVAFRSVGTLTVTELQAGADSTVIGEAGLLLGGAADVFANALALTSLTGTVTQTAGVINADTLSVAGTAAMLDGDNTVTSFNAAVTNGANFRSMRNLTVTSLTAGADSTLTGVPGLRLAGNVDVGNNRLTLRSDGAVSQNGAGLINARRVQVRGADTAAAAATTVALDLANAVDEFAARASGSVVFRSVNDLTVTSLTAGADSTLTGEPGLHLTGNVNVGANALTLRSDGMVDQTGGIVTAASLDVRGATTAAANSVALGAAANAVATFSAMATNAVAFRSSRPTLTTGVVSGGDVALTADNALFLADAITVAGNASLTGDSITAGATGTVTLTTGTATLTANSIDLSGGPATVIATGPMGSVVLQPLGPRAVTLGATAAGTLSLQMGTLTRISTGTLSVRAGNQAVTLAGDVLLRPSIATLNLRGASVAQTAGQLDVARLTGTTSVGGFVLDADGNTIDSLGGITAARDLNVRSGVAQLAVDGAVVAGAAVPGTEPGAMLRLTADDLAIDTANGSLAIADRATNTPGRIELRPHIGTRTLVLGGSGPANAFVLTDLELARIQPTAPAAASSPTLSFGVGAANVPTGTGPRFDAITLAGPVVFRGGGAERIARLELFATGTVTQTAGQLAVATVAGAVTGGVDLRAAGNAIDVWALATGANSSVGGDATPGSVQLVSTRALTITADQVAAELIEIVTPGITLAASLTTQSADFGTVRLRTTPGFLPPFPVDSFDITQTAGRIVSARLSVSATGNIMLDRLNAVGALVRGTDTAGGVALFAGRGATVRTDRTLTVRDDALAGQNSVQRTDGRGSVLTLQAPDLVIDALARLLVRDDAPTGGTPAMIVLGPAAADGAVLLGGPAGTATPGALTLDTDELTRIEAPRLAIGSSAVQAGDVTFLGDIDLRNATTFADPRVRELQLNANGSVTQAAGTRLNVETLSGTVGGSVILPGLNVINAVRALSVGGDLTLRIGGRAVSGGGGVLPPSLVAATGQPQDATGVAALVLDDVRVGNGRLLTVQADDLDIRGAGVTAPDGGVRLRPETAGQALLLGGVVDGAVGSEPSPGLVLSLTAEELNRVIAGVLRLGATSAGPIVQGRQAIDLTGRVTRLELLSGFGVDQRGARINDQRNAALTVGELAITVDTAGRASVLDNAAAYVWLGADNAIGSIARIALAIDRATLDASLPTNTVTVRQAPGRTLTVAGDGIDLSREAGRITLIADTMAIGAAVSAPGGTIELAPRTPGRAVALGGTAAGALSLDAAALGLLTTGGTGVLRIGRSTDVAVAGSGTYTAIGGSERAGFADSTRLAGDITLAGDVALRDRFDQLELYAGVTGTDTGRITQAANTVLDVRALAGGSRLETILLGANRIQALVARTPLAAADTGVAFRAGTEAGSAAQSIFALRTGQALLTVAAEVSVGVGPGAAGAGTAVQTGGVLALLADDLALDAALVAAGGTVALTPFSAGRHVALARATPLLAGSDELALSRIELEGIRAATLRIGDAPQIGGFTAPVADTIRQYADNLDFTTPAPIDGQARPTTLSLAARGDIQQRGRTGAVADEIEGNGPDTGSVRGGIRVGTLTVTTDADAWFGADNVVGNLGAVTVGIAGAPGIFVLRQAADTLLTVVDSVTAVGGPGSRVTLITDRLDIAGANGRLSAPDGTVEILPRTAGRAVTLGGSVPNTLALSTDALMRIGIAGSAIQILRIGRSLDSAVVGNAAWPLDFAIGTAEPGGGGARLRTAGDITLAGDVTLRTRVSRLELFAGTEPAGNGSIVQTGGALDVPDLALESRLETGLDSATNRIDRLVAREVLDASRDTETGRTTGIAVQTGTAATAPVTGGFTLATQNDLTILGDVRSRGVSAPVTIEAGRDLVVGTAAQVGAIDRVLVRAGADGTDALRIIAGRNVLNHGALLGTGLATAAAPSLLQAGGTLTNFGSIVLGWGQPFPAGDGGVLVAGSIVNTPTTTDQALIQTANFAPSQQPETGFINAFQVVSTGGAIDNPGLITAARDVRASRAMTLAGRIEAGGNVRAGTGITGTGTLIAGGDVAGLASIGRFVVAGCVCASVNVSMLGSQTENYAGRIDITGQLNVTTGLTVGLPGSPADPTTRAGAIVIDPAGRLVGTDIQATGPGGIAIAPGGVVIARSVTASAGDVANAGRIEGALLQSAGTDTIVSATADALNRVVVTASIIDFNVLRQDLAVGAAGNIVNTGLLTTVTQAAAPSTYNAPSLLAGAARRSQVLALPPVEQPATLALSAGGGISDGGIGSIVTQLSRGDRLTLSAGGRVALEGANIFALGTSTVGGGRLRGQSISVLGDLTSTGDFTLLADGELGIGGFGTAPVLRVAGAFTLIAGGGITATSATMAAAGVLGLTAAGSITLDSSTLTGAAVTLAGNGGIAMTAGTLAADGTIGLTAGGGITLNDGTLNGSAVTLAAGGDVTLRRGSVTARAGDLAATAGLAMTVQDTSLAASGRVSLAAGGAMQLLAPTVSAEIASFRAATLRLNGGRYTIGEAILFAAPGGITAGATTTVGPRDGARRPVVLFDTRSTVGIDPLLQARSDVVGLPPDQQATQVRGAPGAQVPGSFGPATSTPGGALTLALDAGTSPVFLLLDNGSATGTIIAGRLGIQAASGGVTLTGTLGGFPGVEAARFADITRPIDAVSLGDFRVNACVVGSINCVVPPAIQVLPQRPAERINFNIEPDRLDSAEVVIPNVAETDYQ